MDKYQGISSAVRNERGCNDRLAKGRRRCKHADLVGNQRLESCQLRLLQLAAEGDFGGERHTIVTLVIQFRNGAVASDEIKRRL